MADFMMAHDFAAKWEGGLAEHPNDPGGITNFGVSLRWLRSEGLEQGDIDGDGDVDADDIRGLTFEQAAALFKLKFWDAYRLDEVPQLTATCHYDCAMNTGPRQATLITQRACNSLLGVYGVPLVVDGVFGPKTRAFLRSNSTRKLAELMSSLREDFYRDLVIKKPRLACFEGGWLNRCADLRRYIGVMP